MTIAKTWSDCVKNSSYNFIKTAGFFGTLKYKIHPYGSVNLVFRRSATKKISTTLDLYSQ